MAAPTVEDAIHELMHLAWNLVYQLLEERGLLEDWGDAKHRKNVRERED